ncbi:hypothetical protein BASA61_001327 [Batrachochytrium salamandrivorans]|nr:hypothetical protein BASA60_007863 [Batrachochytrium salamandrivorans]KAH6574946.1 hypothetical protein BASA62_002206 [Batrachochytrium salamandrivorans]KAH6602269.1 hypothetical protein BASA61_001327 [Batrachochytrium salamandrivorans]KAH9274568.1 hypothetical protein BASA83_003204 [Batrachochytrium salamandrivorans]KAJ1336672.1 hypothetical protein BSLG_006991 [Batrachochytrium salamandrivorans]
MTVFHENIDAAVMAAAAAAATGSIGTAGHRTSNTSRPKKIPVYTALPPDGTTLCPITGLAAKFTDPRTGIPYATPEAYETIQQLANGDFGWAPSIKCFIHRFNEAPPKDVPDGWMDCTLSRPFVVPELEPARRSSGYH